MQQYAAKLFSFKRSIFKLFLCNTLVEVQVKIRKLVVGL